MITAIPMTEDRVASHFTKADCLVFLDERGVEINRIDNPALAANCAGKQKMIDLLAEQQVNRVVVRNIGEQMLGKLLARQFAVYQTRCGRRLASELADPLASDLVLLDQASQGRQSMNHEAKNKSGGCGCHHKASESAGHSCHGHGHESGGQKSAHCCHGKKQAGTGCQAS